MIEPKTLNALFTRDGGEPTIIESIESPAAVVPRPLPPNSAPAPVAAPATGGARAVVPSQAVPPAAPVARRHFPLRAPKHP